MENYFSCIECGFFGSYDDLSAGNRSLKCPRCAHSIIKKKKKNLDFYGSLILSTLILVLVSFGESFLSFRSGNDERIISILDIPFGLFDYSYYGVGGVVFIFVIALPVMFLFGLLLIFINSKKKIFQNVPRGIGRFLSHTRHWVMMEVFLAGVLVGLIKVLALFDLTFEYGFWLFFMATLLFSYILNEVKTHDIWNWVLSPYQFIIPRVSDDQIQQKTYLCCHVCHSINSSQQRNCIVCHSPIYFREPLFLQKVLSLLISATLLYIPANLYPIMETSTLGKKVNSTILEGVVLFFNDGSYFVAGVIFGASIMIPLMKIGILYWLCYQHYFIKKQNEHQLMQLYRMTELVGKWSMIDIFVVALMVALIQLEGFVVIEPGIATQSFTGVVIFTMLAAIKFDTRVFWESNEPSEIMKMKGTV